MGSSFFHEKYFEGLLERIQGKQKGMPFAVFNSPQSQDIVAKDSGIRGICFNYASIMLHNYYNAKCFHS